MDCIEGFRLSSSSNNQKNTKESHNNLKEKTREIEQALFFNKNQFLDYNVILAHPLKELHDYDI